LGHTHKPHAPQSPACGVCKEESMAHLKHAQQTDIVGALTQTATFEAGRAREAPLRLDAPGRQARRVNVGPSLLCHED
jgi:hypothetical protein